MTASEHFDLIDRRGWREGFRHVLREFDACLFHCSGYIKFHGTAETAQLTVFERLRETAAHAKNWEVSCSTARPGFNFNYGGTRNSFLIGPVGLVLDPLDNDSITGAGTADFGSQPNPAVGPGRRFIPYEAVPQELEDIEHAVKMHARDRHNELTVHRYNVIGLFIQPFNIAGEVEYLVDGKPQVFGHADLHHELGGLQLPTYLRDDKGMFHYHWSGIRYQKGARVRARDLYR